MRLDVVSIFPDYLAPLDLSLIGKARRNGLLELHVHDLRDFTHDRHRTVDDTPYGGGAGMVMKPEPWAEALDHVRAQRPDGRPVLVVPGPGGVPFTQAMARQLAQEPWLAFACGRYEGIDERVYEHAAETMDVRVVSLGDYVLNGGEVAVLAMVEAIGRLLPGVVGNAESLVEESHEDGLLEYPVYTKPASWQGKDVPDVLLSGDHGRIAAWRHQQRLDRTAQRRPDLLHASAALSADVELDVREATPADAGELMTLTRACCASEPASTESLDDVLAELAAWRTSVVRSGGRLVASVRTRPAPDEPRTWQIERLVVAPDLRGRGLGRRLLELAEAQAPADATGFLLSEVPSEVADHRRWRRAGYRIRPATPGRPGTAGAVDLVKRRRA